MAVLARLSDKLEKLEERLKRLEAPEGRDLDYPSLHAPGKVYVAHLRRKIEAYPARPRYILTEPRVGYRLASE